jgi:tRNA(Ile)-lysidine synthase
MALLHLLVSIRGWHEATLSVVTIDHGIHPRSSEQAQRVEEACEGLGVPVQRHRLALGPQTSEAEARAARYAVLDALNVDRVALAHHRDDQAETVLLHLMRGTGTAGLAGIGWRRGRYVRPLLDISRAELEAWVRHHDVHWEEDPTNRDPRFLRNRLRAEVLPLLESLRPGAVAALARSASQAAADAAWLEDAVDALPEEEVRPPWSVAWVRDTASPLVRRALLRARPSLTARQLDAATEACARGSGRVELSGGAVLEVVGGQLVLRDGS